MLKVGIDIRDLRIAKTGVRTYTEELIKAFNNQNDPDVKFVYLDTFLPVYTGKNKFLKLIEHIRFTLWKQLFLPLVSRLKGCNIIFCADFFVPYFKAGMKTVPVLHDAFFFEYPAHYNKLWLFLFHNLGVRAAKKADAIITPTQYTKRKIAEHADLPSEKIKVIYEGPKTFDAITEKDDVLTRELAGQKYILHVGVMEKRKNIINLLKAYLILVKDHPEVKLILVGQFSPKKDMNDETAILDFIHNNNLDKQVLLPGYVPDSKLIHYYRYALLYVFPSVNEGFGIPVLEAFEQGLPVAIADNSCLPEIASNAAVTFNPHNPQDICSKLKLVLENDALRAALIAAGKERIKNFSWEITAKQTMNLFKRL